ncbi:putative R3h domain containing protein [Quillaja saponaria]|uniref:R3h domain containing protein n=1 Tax=Quillaja saponaria TaxID=32244 RepID=A0AAD7Q4Z8_QUISA|nr:putative R3h domain containing protein [Quillaja saponaria]
MEGSAEDHRAPESWEAADLDASMSQLMLSSNKDSKAQELAEASASSASTSTSSSAVASEDVINQIDQFLREAIQNPRERLSILRMEQDVEKFICDPTQQRLEFQQLPTSYLRLAAHRIAQHYSLQSMVLLDNSLQDGSGCRIIVSKPSECRLPLIRLADIPVNLPAEDSTVFKVAIKQRPQKQSQFVNNGNSNASNSNSSKSVEERKEEYNRARARIFNLSSNGDKSTCVSDTNSGRGLIDSSTSSSRSARSSTENEPVVRYKQGNSVAIFWDCDVDCKDPDYDRSYDRYMQRFDPGFGFSGGPYTMLPMYTSALNYNTEFPQFGPTYRPQISTEHQPQPLPQHLPGRWAAASSPAGIGYGHPKTVMASFNHNRVGLRSSSTMYLHSSQYHSQHPGFPFIHHEHVHQPFSQSHQQQPAACFGLARPR